MVAAGVDRGAIQRWLDDGRLHRIHHGVYAVDHRAPSVLGDYMATVLACGPDTVLSHRADCHLLRLLPGRPPPPEVTVPSTAGRRRPGIKIHRVRALPAADTCVFHGLPITTAPRALLDMAPQLPQAQLARACHQAWIHHGVSPAHVEACIARNPAKKGAAKLLLALGSDVTLSVLEDGFLVLLRKHGLPAPRTNVDRHGDKVDCHWPAIDLTVELLSYRFHGSRAAFETDVARRRRSDHLAFTYGDVFERGPRTIAELRARLDQRATSAAATGGGP